jgi:hypothetical protein
MYEEQVWRISRLFIETLILEMIRNSKGDRLVVQGGEEV